MQEPLPTFDWGALLRLVGLWLVVVFLALRALDLLFPRLRRGEGDTPQRPEPPIRRALGPRALAASQPIQPARDRRPANERAPAVEQARWSANLRIVVVLLLIWIGASFVPAIFAPQLNQVTLLTGFPLGYYMGSQGSLIVFLGLITAYAWRAG